MIFLFLLVGIAVFFIWAVHPSSDSRTRLEPYRHIRFAHRGLWDSRRTIPENSMAAFRRAVSNNCAIELDVHLTKDGKLAVFHDDNLKRMCGRPESIEQLTWDEISQLSLQETKHHIPLFSDVLREVRGKVPLLIELKLPNLNTAICPLVYAALQNYSGPYLIESFNPMGLGWFKKHAPEVIRGQLASKYSPGVKVPLILRMLSASLLVNLVSRPHFVAYDIHTTDGMGCKLNRRFFHVPMFGWTIRSQQEYERYSTRFDGVIFERFLPVPAEEEVCTQEEKNA